METVCKIEAERKDELTKWEKGSYSSSSILEGKFHFFLFLKKLSSSKWGSGVWVYRLMEIQNKRKEHSERKISLWLKHTGKNYWDILMSCTIDLVLRSIPCTIWLPCLHQSHKKIVPFKQVYRKQAIRSRWKLYSMFIKSATMMENIQTSDRCFALSTFQYDIRFSVIKWMKSI